MITIDHVHRWLPLLSVSCTLFRALFVLISVLANDWCKVYASPEYAQYHFMLCFNPYARRIPLEICSV